MKKLTDEVMAKALGWKRVEGLSSSENKRWYWRQEITSRNSQTCPAFTTSLDAIVAEIEARGLKWMVFSYGHAAVQEQEETSWAKHSLANGETAPLALCAALLSYLKEVK